MMKQFLLVLIFISGSLAQAVRIPQIRFSPEKYVCYFTNDSLTIDGKLNEIPWKKAKWTDNFVDIRGRQQPKPRFRTRVKMLWDKHYFYIGAQLQESDIWGVLKKHDATLYKDNNFEVFIDPDGDTQKYCELELNALNTTWDLLLIKPYRDMRKPAISYWEIRGLKHKVAITGTLNNPSDKDSCWTVELALPWKVFKELTTMPVPPKNGEQWRVNFSRVEWYLKKQDGAYVKSINPVTHKRTPDYWVWSPQGLLNLHYPEMWGYVQFSTEIVGGHEVPFVEKKEEQAKWYLRQIYYKERMYYQKHHTFTADLKILGIKNKVFANYITPPVIECTSDMFEACLLKKDKKTKLCIRNDGWIYSRKNVPKK